MAPDTLFGRAYIWALALTVNRTGNRMQMQAAMMRAGKLFPRPARVGVTIGKPVFPGDRTYDEIVQALHRDVGHLLNDRTEHGSVQQILL